MKKFFTYDDVLNFKAYTEATDKQTKDSIYTKIDELINQQVNINCVASVYLQLLKNFIIDNDYNAEGFKEHCMKMMRIGNSQFLNLSHKFRFKTPAFKLKKII